MCMSKPHIKICFLISFRFCSKTSKHFVQKGNIFKYILSSKAFLWYIRKPKWKENNFQQISQVQNIEVFLITFCLWKYQLISKASRVTGEIDIKALVEVDVISKLRPSLPIKSVLGDKSFWTLPFYKFFTIKIMNLKFCLLFRFSCSLSNSWNVILLPHSAPSWILS